MPPRRLPNEQDNKVIERLATAPSGSLTVDRFAGDLRAGNRKSPQMAVVELRLALIQVYVAAAKIRESAKVPKSEIEFAEAALTSLRKALSHLEKIKPHHARGLAAILAIPGDDSKGVDEWNGFAARCWDAAIEVGKTSILLDKEIRAEKKKPAARGERKKRLRILVEALADWWVEATGKTIAPYVQSKPLGNHRAFVAGRRGRFVEFSLSVLSRLDGFKESEVISAIINVYERRRRARLQRSAAKKSQIDLN